MSGEGTVKSLPEVPREAVIAEFFCFLVTENVAVFTGDDAWERAHRFVRGSFRSVLREQNDAYGGSYVIPEGDAPLREFVRVMRQLHEAVGLEDMPWAKVRRVEANLDESLIF